MSKSIWIGAVFVTVLVLGGIAYLQYGRQPVVEQSGHAAIESSQALPSAQPSASLTQDTIATPDAAALPGTDNDKVVQSDLESLFGSALHDWLWPDRIIQRIVATIDSLDGEPVPLRLRPLRYVEGLLMVDTAENGSITLSPENSKRYAPYVDLFTRVDAQRVASFYLRYQAQFQKAHEALGYSGQSFNDRLLKTVDHLLATPDVPPPIKLARPHVLYEFDDAHLERLSSGQKIMLRMGSKNAEAVKAKLRDIRAALVAPR